MTAGSRSWSGAASAASAAAANSGSGRSPSSPATAQSARPPVDAERREGVGAGQGLEGPRVHLRPPPELVHALEPGAAGRHQGLDGRGLEPLDLAEAEAERHAAVAEGLEGAVPIARVHVDGPDPHPVLAGVAHDLGGGVEAHRLAVEQRTGEGRRVVALDPGGHVDEEREAGGVGLGEPVVGEALDLLEAAEREVLVVAALAHAADERLAEAVDVAEAAEGGHGAAQPVRLGRGEAGGDDGDLHGLLLEERHAKGLLQHPAQRVGRVVHRLLAAPAAQVGVHHVPLDGARAHDRHLDHQVVEVAGLEAGQHAHLRAALHLEDADGIGAAQHLVDGRVLGRHGVEAEPAPVAAFDQVEGLAHAGEHAEAEHVHLEDAEGVQVVLVPLDLGAPLHGRVGDGDHLGERAAGDHHAARVLGEVAGGSRGARPPA